jgi:hypothetical protein
VIDLYSPFWFNTDLKLPRDPETIKTWAKFFFSKRAATAAGPFYISQDLEEVERENKRRSEPLVPVYQWALNLLKTTTLPSSFIGLTI